MQLHTTYFGPVDWYRQLVCANPPFVCDTENYVKQTTRNHCRIATANGVQKLTVPVSLPSKVGTPIRDVRISDHGNWRHQHWEALCSAYGMSPFFDYYADDIRPFFENRWEFLFDYNEAITSKMLHLIGLDSIPQHVLCEYRAKQKDSAAVAAESSVYYQTFQMRHGFIPDLSILDLLFNMGPEALPWLLLG